MLKSGLGCLILLSTCGEPSKACSCVLTGIESFVLAVSGEVAPDHKVLKKIATDEDHLFMVANMAQMSSAVIAIVNHICPPYTGTLLLILVFTLHTQVLCS